MMTLNTQSNEDSLMMSMGQSIKSNLGQYQVVEELSRGGSGFVFKIRERKKNTQYALKVISKVPPNNNPKLQSKIAGRIESEISMHKLLNDCPSVISFRTTFQDQENCYIVLELCQDGDITQYIKKHGKLSIQEVREFGRQIAQGLKYMHDHQVIHRDIKPNNILISKNRTAKICDFGLAARGESFQDMVGTLNYSSPEIMCNEAKYENEVDMWSFGCTLFYMATGTPLFSFSKRSEAVDYFLNNELSLKFPNNFDEDLEGLIRSLVVKNPKERLNATKVLESSFLNPKSNSKELSPLKTLHLESRTLQLEDGTIVIDQNGITKPATSALPFTFHVDQLGTTITIKKGKKERSYPLETLPEKYHSLYSYCKNVIEILEDTSSKSMFKNQKGIFKIFKSGNFLASFANGKTVFMKEDEVKKGQSEKGEVATARKYYQLMKELN